MDRQVIWLPQGVKVIEETPQWKIDNAKAFVNSVTSGKVAICYKQVKKYPLAEGAEIRNRIKELKEERISPNTVSDRAQYITLELAKLRSEERRYYLFDEHAYRQLNSAYCKLIKALELLVAEGEVEAYYVSPRGMLRVEWWTVHETIHIQQVDTWKFYRPAPTGVVVDSGNRICTPSHKSHGRIEKANENWGSGPATKGSGELAPHILKQRDQDYTDLKTDHKAVYVKGRELREWLIAVIALYTKPEILQKRVISVHV